MKILVTGTAGFVGFHLARLLLEEGHEVAGIDAVTEYYDVTLKRDRLAQLAKYDAFTAHEYYLEDFDKLSATFDEFQPEIVVHLAAQAGVRYSLTNPRAYIDSNVVGTFNVMELAKVHKVRHLLAAATSSVYGANTDFPFQETDKTQTPLTIYAATKAATELMGHCYAHLHHVPTTMFRFFTVYGPWGRPDMALFKFTKAMLADEPIDVYNHGKMVRDFTYIDDLVKAIRLLIDAIPPGQDGARDGFENDSLSPVAPFRIVNIGNADPVELTDYIKAAEDCLGISAKKNMMPMQAGDVPKTQADTSLLRHLTGYQPTTKVEEGVRRFVEWYRDYYAV